MSWGLLGALLAALCYGVSSVLQAVAASRTETTAALDPRLLLRLSKQWPFIAAMCIDAVGFVASILALRTLPLFLVESAIAGSVGVTAVLAARFLHLRLGQGERAALIALCMGLVLLAVSAQAEPALATSRSTQWLLLAGTLVIVALAAGSARFLRGRAGAGRAALAGRPCPSRVRRRRGSGIRAGAGRVTHAGEVRGGADPAAATWRAA